MKRVLTDLVSLVRFALHEDKMLRLFTGAVHERFEGWLAQRETFDKKFTPEQRQWLEMIRDHIASSVAIGPDDFDSVPFNQGGGLGKAHQLFGGA